MSFIIDLEKIVQCVDPPFVVQLSLVLIGLEFVRFFAQTLSLSQARLSQRAAEFFKIFFAHTIGSTEPLRVSLRSNSEKQGSAKIPKNADSQRSTERFNRTDGHGAFILLEWR